MVVQFLLVCEQELAAESQRLGAKKRDYSTALHLLPPPKAAVYEPVAEPVTKGPHFVRRRYLVNQNCATSLISQRYIR